MLTGRVSLATHPWLADHAVRGVVLVPGAALVELVLRAGDEVGCGRVEELTLQAPLVLPETGGVQLQVVVGGADERGVRAAEVFARRESAGGVTGDEGGWILHGSGALAPETAAGAEPGATNPVVGSDLLEWPPRGAEPVDVAGFYDVMAGRGYGYGPAFQGLRAVWRRGDEVFAEVALPEDIVGASGEFGLHPALLDAGLQSGLTSLFASAEGNRMPFSWRGMTLHAVGATSLRVRMAPAADDPATVTMDMADASGAPVASVEALATREVSEEQLAAAVVAAGGSSGGDSLFRVEWVPGGDGVSAVGGGSWGVLGSGGLLVPSEGEVFADVSAVALADVVPGVVVWECPVPVGGEVPGVVHEGLAAVLG
ncbi:polyketide synthase dehydratase domain-containing protein, partial [Streptomyces sp. NPDC059651]|uniref:polyketide synthase dehydratase domain-containing protein n=1 Tax=Streptomyces sp. NPDC059651 TaxID=3346897 RepID=UPI0036C6F737